MEVPIKTAGSDRSKGLVPSWWLLLSGAAAFGIAVWLRSLSFAVALASFVAAGTTLVTVRWSRAGAAGWFASGVLVSSLAAALFFERRMERVRQDAEDLTEDMKNKFEKEKGDAQAAMQKAIAALNKEFVLDFRSFDREPHRADVGQLGAPGHKGVDDPGRESRVV